MQKLFFCHHIGIKSVNLILIHRYRIILHTMPRFIRILFILLFTSFHLNAQNNFKDENELKKSAAELFENEEYGKAYKLYSQLVSNYPKDPNYNFRLGVCMLFAEPNKKKCYSYLEFANKNIDDCEKEAKFYLAKAYHINFRFDEAMALYSQYKNIASSAQSKKLNVENEIQACKNGKRLLSNIKELVVLDKKELAENDYFRSYDLRQIGGKLLIKPAEFLTTADKKKKNKSIIYMPKSNDQLFFSSYGEKAENGKDLFIVKKLPNGEWSKPQNVGIPINTPYDEDYPFLHPNGKILYFASKGHNSMGGYDIFKSEFNESTQKWSDPVNMDFPVNTPNDDILFVTDSLEKTAYFSSSRYSPYGKIDVYKINTERRAPETLLIKGSVLKKTEGQSQKSVIKIKNIDTEEDEGTFEAGTDGNYNLKISNGGKFIFTVETPGFKTQSEGITIAKTESLTPYRQVIYYKNEKLIIENLFESSNADESGYLQFLDLIEEQSKLEVNADNIVDSKSINEKQKEEKEIQPNNSKEIASTENTTDFTTNSPNTNTVTAKQDEIVKNNTNTKTENKNDSFSNAELVKIAKEDAEELKIEAQALTSDANEAKAFADKIKLEANKKSLLAEEKQIAYNQETNETQKENLKIEADKIRSESTILIQQANTAENVARQINEDAINKNKEAELTSKYAIELEKANKNKNNQQAITQLEVLQKEIEELASKSNQRSNLSDNYKVQAKQKEEEIEKQIKKNETTQKEYTILNNELNTLEKEINDQSDKELKENLIAQREELKNEMAEKNKELELNTRTQKQLVIDKEALESQADFVQNILNSVKSNEEITLSPIENSQSENSTDFTQQKDNSTTTDQTENNSEENKFSVSQKEIKSNEEKLAQTESKIIWDTQTEMDEEKWNEQIRLLTEYRTIKKQIIKLKNEQVSSISQQEARNKEYETIKQLEEDTYKAENLIAIAKEKIQKINSESVIAKNTEVENNSTSGNEQNKTESQTTENSETAKQTSVTNTTEKKENSVSEESQLVNQKQDEKLFSTESTEPNSSTTQLNQNSKQEEELFSQRNFSSPKSTKLYNEALTMYNEAKKNQNKLQSSNQTITENNSVETKMNSLNVEADEISLQAVQKRRSAKNLSGTEKQNAIRESAELESKAGSLRLESARLKSDLHTTQFTSNETKLGIYKNSKIDFSKAEWSKASALADEAATLFKQSVILKKEAEAQQSDEARAAAYHNAEEKENLALTKQNEALGILKNTFPKISIETSQASTTLSKQAKENQIVSNSSLKEEQANIERQKNNALKILFDAEKAEYEKLSSENTVVKNSKDRTIIEKKNQSQQLVLEANKTMIKANDEKDEFSKNYLVIEANEKIKKSITILNEAIQLSVKPEIQPKEENQNTTETTVSNDQIASKSELKTNEEPPVNNSNPSNNSLVNENVNDRNKQNPNRENEVNKQDEINKKYNQSDTEVENENTNQNDISLNTNNREKNVNENKEGLQNKQAITNSETEPNNESLINELIARNENTEKSDPTDNAQSENISTAPSKTNKSNFDEEKIKEIKSTQDYVNYQSISNESIKYEKLAEKEQVEADKNMELASQYLKESTGKRMQADKLNGSEKDKLREEAILLDRKANYHKMKSDSLAELASNTRALAESKKLEADLFLQSIDKQSYENISGIIEAEKTSDSTSTKANENNTNDNSNDSNITKNENSVTESNAEQNQNETTQNTKQLVKINSSEANEKNSSAESATETTNKQTTNANRNETELIPSTSSTKDKNTQGEEFEISNREVYTSAKPIPINESLPSGLVFRVQIGAFKNPVPVNLFKGLNPIGGEKTAQGLIRYQAGLFKDFTKANNAKNEVRKIGYKDAFVVAYFNGKRIDMNQAISMTRNLSQETAVNTQNTTNEETKVENIALKQNNSETLQQTMNNSNQTSQPELIVNKPVNVQAVELTTYNGLLYTVQIGVFSTDVSSTQLLNLKPVFREKLPNGNFRYTAGIYLNEEKTIADKQKVNNLGIKDAFVSAYLNGKRISTQEAQQKIKDGMVNYPTEQPIQFDNNLIPVTTNQAPQSVETKPAPESVKIDNGVVKGPDPNPENGVKIGEDGLCFKVQIGAFKNKVPENAMANFLKIKSWPIQTLALNDLYLYTVGNFIDGKSARVLLRQVYDLGITDAFISVFNDGKKLSGEEARNMINR